MVSISRRWTRDRGLAVVNIRTQPFSRPNVKIVWGTSADDILWRRSKLGLVLTAAEASVLDSHLGGTRKASAGDNVAVAE
jgi:hypothetical protein